MRRASYCFHMEIIWMAHKMCKLEKSSHLIAPVWISFFFIISLSRRTIAHFYFAFTNLNKFAFIFFSYMLFWYVRFVCFFSLFSNSLCVYWPFSSTVRLLFHFFFTPFFSILPRKKKLIRLYSYLSYSFRIGCIYIMLRT